MVRAPVHSWPTVVRVSRGVSALGATMFFRARSHSHEPGCPGSVERDQRYVRSVSASQHSSTSTRILSPIPAHRHRLVVGRALCGVPPTETGDHRVSRRVDRFGGSYERHWGRVLPSQDRRDDRASDASVANPTRYRHTLFRGARCPIRKDSPRPLRLHRRDAMKSSPVRDAFYRRGMCCSCSVLSNGDCTSGSPLIRFC
jgi:hypothetical protein